MYFRFGNPLKSSVNIIRLLLGAPQKGRRAGPSAEGEGKERKSSHKEEKHGNQVLDTSSDLPRNMNICRKAIRERERGEKRKRRASVQSISSNSVSTDQESSSDCEVEKVVVKKNSTKLAAIFLGKREVECLRQ